MRTSFISLFGLVGIALAAPATLDGSDYACSETSPYSMTQCCPAKGPCNFGPMPKIAFTEDFLKSFCSGEGKVASCCIYSDPSEPLSCKPVL